MKKFFTIILSGDVEIKKFGSELGMIEIRFEGKPDNLLAIKNLSFIQEQLMDLRAEIIEEIRLDNKEEY